MTRHKNVIKFDVFKFKAVFNLHYDVIIIYIKMLLYTTIDIKMQAKVYSPGIPVVLTVDIINITSM